MEKYEYILIGGGLASYSAARGVRTNDQNGRILMLCEEPVPPYDRPPLSKKLWKGVDIEEIWCKPESFGVETKLSDKAVSIDRNNKTVTDSKGTQYSYGKLLIATGVSPRRLPFGEGLINYFRTVADYQKLRSQTETKNDFIVIGGGFIGSEIAAALSMNGKNVTLIFPEGGIGAKIFAPSTSEFINNFYREKGVKVLERTKTIDVSEKNGYSKVTIEDSSGARTELTTDAVIAGIGTIPNTELAQAAGLTVTNGIEVNEFLQTSDPDIYSAGDVANYIDASLKTRRRVEHENQANQMGLKAGKNMTGENSNYVHLPFFFSDLFELGYEAVGDLDSRLEMYEDWVEPFKKGVIYYLKDSLVKGVLLWNTWEKVALARELIKAAETIKPGMLKNRIHD